MKPVPATPGPHLVKWLSNTVSAGFPSPAEDFGVERIDLDQILMTHSQATFFMRASGDSMVEYGISDNDILVIKRSRRYRDGHIVVVAIDGEFLVKKLQDKKGQIRLLAGNPSKYPDIVPKDGETLKFWGVVSATITVFPP
jgi:DNA polymerase V